MVASGKMKQPRKPGRPPTGIGEPIGVRLHPGLAAKLEAWIAAQPDPKPSRPEAIRRLLEEALERSRGKR